MMKDSKRKQAAGAHIPSREELTKLFARCHDIIRNNDKLSPEVAFDAMSKLLFARMASSSGGDKAVCAVELKESSVAAILSLLDEYDLSAVPDDVKGIAFEQFLGRTLRGELGQFFTPRTVVDFMIGVVDPCESELICDPCCGSGGFLIRTLDYLADKLGCRDDAERRERIGGSVFGSDANERMARTAQMNVAIHGGEPSGVYHHDGLINVGGIFEGRFDVILTNPPFGAGVSRDQTIDMRELESDPRRIAEYTALYGDEYKRQMEELTRRARGLNERGECDARQMLLLELYETGKMSTLTEVLFIERCIRLLKPGGRMGIVLPEGVLNKRNLQRAREYIEGMARLTLVCSIPQDAFAGAGAGVKSSLVFLRKLTNEEIAHGKTDYEVSLASVSRIGVTARGRSCENELDAVLSELRSCGGAGKVKTVNFKDMRSWCVASNLTHSEYSSDFSLVRIGDILTRVRRKVTIKDGTSYKRLTLRGGGGGIVLRDSVRGEEIGTKNQYAVKRGQLLISKIDARNGAFGIVPDELDGAIVTCNFWTFDVNTHIIYPEVLCAMLSSDRLRSIWESCSNGTTNRHYLQERNFLDMSIPVPPFEVQRAFVDELAELSAQRAALEQKIELLKHDFDSALFEQQES